MAIAWWRESRQREKEVQWPWGWCCLLKRDSRSLTENWALTSHGSWELTEIHAPREAALLPLEVDTGNGAKILPRKWSGINPDTEAHGWLNEVHSLISIAQKTFQASVTSGSPQPYPSSSSSHRRPGLEHAPSWWDGPDKVVFFFFFPNTDNYMKQFIEPGYLWVSEKLGGYLPKIITVALGHLLCGLSFWQEVAGRPAGCSGHS